MKNRGTSTCGITDGVVLREKGAPLITFSVDRQEYQHRRLDDHNRVYLPCNAPEPARYNS